MIEINSSSYDLILFDTNALSGFLQDPAKWVRFFDKQFGLGKSFLCYSAFTLSELWYRQELFQKYLDVFALYPSAMLDGYESIFRKEVANYHEGASISPIVVVPFAIKAPGLTPKEKLTSLFDKAGFKQKTEYWTNGRQEVIDGIRSLTNNYPPKSDKYTTKEVEDFVSIASTQQIALRDKGFVDAIERKGCRLEIAKFPSIQATSYVVFYKFYQDRRKSTPSDVFDMIISSLLPYVDCFITEGNLCEIVRIVQKRHSFLTHLKTFSIKEVVAELRRA